MNRSKQIGTSFETAVVRFMQEAGFDVERRALSGNLDKGDIAGLSGWTLECKAEKAISLAQYMTEAQAEALNAGTPWYAAIVKRRQKNVADSYVVMPLKIFCGFLNWWSCPSDQVYLEDEAAEDEELEGEGD